MLKCEYVIIVFPSAIGKTSLAKRFCMSSYIKEEFPTIGVDYFQRSIELQGEVYAVNVYDTAGEYILLQGSCICILTPF